VTAANDRVRVTTFVAVSPLEAFRIFTGEIDAWWRRGQRYRLGPGANSTMRFEGEAGGQLVEDLGSGRSRVIGKVLAWEPGARLVFEWRAVKFERDQVTEVEVSFEPGDGGTRVLLEHRGWAAIPDDSVVRHGRAGREFIAWMGMWWADLATSLRELASKR
jgi:uncharacterized protein YndB with AHSA1/START domain